MPSEAQAEQQQQKYYWHREYRIVFPTLNLEYNNLENKVGIQMSFDISKDLTQQTNKAKITLRNLTAESRAKIEKEDLQIDVYAGYREMDGPLRVFSGTIIQTVTKDEGEVVTTEIEASDGQVALRDAAFSLSYAPGTSGLTVVKAIAGNMGLPLILGENVTFESYPNGYSFVGKAGTALDEVCNANGLTWSIQNGNLQIILGGGALANRGLVFSASSGLIGSPARIVKANSKEDKETPKRKRKQSQKKEKTDKKAGWKIETLLAPTISPGDAIKVESRMINGWFRVETMKHTGESDEGQFKTQMDIIEGLGG